MRALLDTHALLWWVRNDARFSARARAVVTDPSSELLFSVAGAWEIAIKCALGQLTLAVDPATYVTTQLQINGIRALSIELAHALAVYSLPQHHKDPFDRLLVAQAVVERVPIITGDPQIGRYGVQVIW